MLETLNWPRPLRDCIYPTLSRKHLRPSLLSSGQPLQNVALAAQLGVSRTPVREVLGHLASQGLLDSDGRSFVVPSRVNPFYRAQSCCRQRAMAESQKRSRRRSGPHQQGANANRLPAFDE